jgi:SAM-dependent methyltransferase
VVALDIRLDRARSARERAGAAAHVLVASAEALPFAREAFTKVTCIDVIEHVDKDTRAATELARVLGTCGYLVMTTLRQDRSSILRKVEFDDHLREYSWERFCSLSEGAGLQILDTFEFYRWFSRLAWEGQYMIAGAGWMRRIPGLSTLLWAILSVVARLDPLVRNPGAGLGQIAEKQKRAST